MSLYMSLYSLYVCVFQFIIFPLLHDSLAGCNCVALIGKMVKIMYLFRATQMHIAPYAIVSHMRHKFLRNCVAFKKQLLKGGKISWQTFLRRQNIGGKLFWGRPDANYTVSTDSRMRNNF